MERGWKGNTELSPACPRCGSSNTKFCYYNNYSLTQPRYFCKGCRRYWTKGGSLRNVPVGGGCRKTRRAKSSRAAPRPHPHRIHSTSTSASAAGASTPIDLAAVYANFLHQPPPANQASVPPPIEFPNYHMNQLSTQLPPENTFFECGSFPIRFPETQLLGNPAYFGSLDAAFHKQQQFSAAPEAVGNSTFAGMSSDVLPPLPGEETTAATEWASSDVMLQNDMMGSEVEATQQNSSELLSPNFSGLNLEAIFRS